VLPAPPRALHGPANGQGILGRVSYTLGAAPRPGSARPLGSGHGDSKRLAAAPTTRGGTGSDGQRTPRRRDPWLCPRSRRGSHSGRRTDRGCLELSASVSLWLAPTGGEGAWSHATSSSSFDLAIASVNSASNAADSAAHSGSLSSRFFGYFGYFGYVGYLLEPGLEPPRMLEP
jgi:hypothetical protein